MDWDVIAPMVFMIVLVVTGGGVLLLRPIAKRAGALLEAMAQEKTAVLAARAHPQHEVARLREEMEALQTRLGQLEERQEFTEGMLGEGSRHALPRQP